ncbi:ABC transporter ATP-binding protein [Candidatus Margulisiibacteriota bacterium]
MKLMLRLIKFVLPYWQRLIIVFTSVFFYAVANIYFMPLVRDLTYDIERRDIGLFTFRIFEGFLLVIIRCFAQYGQIYQMSWVGQRAIMKIRIRIFEHLQKLSMDFFAKWKSGEIISRSSNDLQIVQNMIVSNFIEIVPQIITFIGVVIYLAFLNWKLLLVTFFTLPFFAGLISRFGTAMRRISRHTQRKTADVISVLQEVIYGIGIVKAFAMEKKEIKRYTDENEKTFAFSMKSTHLYALQQPVMFFLQISAIFILIWIGGMEIVKGNLTVGNFLSFFMGIILLIDPVIGMGKVYTRTQQGLAALERVFHVLDTEPTVKEKPKAYDLPKITGEVEFKDVNFFYEKKEGQVLKDINLIVKPGEVIALVGSSGTGKTTMVNLIPRFYDITDGELLIDGHNIQEVTFKSLRSQMAIVTQETILFSGTIRENIAYGKENAKNDEIEAAAQAANAHDFISMFPSGYGTIIGERGVRLSGGQKQRISIARAILRNPRILILDEATSSLDTESERLVQEALEHLMQNRTTFVIAHRLSTIMHADRILVLDEGKIVDIGKHAELLKKSPIYKKLYDLQFRT